MKSSVVSHQQINIRFQILYDFIRAGYVGTWQLALAQFDVSNYESFVHIRIKATNEKIWNTIFPLQARKMFLIETERTNLMSSFPFDKCKNSIIYVRDIWKLRNRNILFHLVRAPEILSCCIWDTYATSLKFVLCISAEVGCLSILQSNLSN